MPITRPWMSASAPPELPGLIAALVWIAFWSVAPPCPSDSCRLRALTMPSVTLELRPSGLPIAIAMSPTSSLVESAKTAGFSPAPGTLITARSSCGNVPTRVPFRMWPVDVVTVNRVEPSDDVVVGDDVALRVEHDPGAEAVARLDLDDRRGHALEHVDEGRLQLGRGRGRGGAAPSSRRGWRQSRRHRRRTTRRRAMTKRNLESIHAALLPIETEVTLRIFHGLLGLPAVATRGRAARGLDGCRGDERLASSAAASRPPARP